jgi:integrase
MDGNFQGLPFTDRHGADMAERLTDRTVAKLKPPASGNRIYYDSEVKGFGLRITAKGARSFILNYRVGGLERRGTIGTWPAWSVQAAREQAKLWRRDVERGIDPLAQREKVRTAPTLKALAEEFMGEDGHAPRLRPSTRTSYDGIIRNEILPTFGRLRVAEVRHPDVEDWHRRLSKLKPIRANRSVAVLSKMMSYAIRRGYRADNPCRHIERNPENTRDRYLSAVELARLAQALAQYGNQVSANAIRFALLTGARRGEVVTARWRDIDLERGIWVKPSAHTKQRKEHRVPLSAPALHLLANLRDASPADAEFVFPGRKKEQHIERLSACWAYVAKTAGLQNARLHDLRHSFASILVSAGASLPLIGQLLGHTQPRTTQRYSHFFDDPLRAAAERVGSFVIGASSITTEGSTRVEDKK